MQPIVINDLLQISDEDIRKTRLKLNVFNGSVEPLEEYKKDPNKINVEWFLWHNKRRYFKEGQIAICLLYLYSDKWLLTTIKKITKELDIENGVGYEAEEIPKYSKYYGRLVLKYHNTHRGIGRTYKSLMNELEVVEILSAAYDGDEFPGYENVRLSFSQLETIIRNKRSGWLDALRNQKAIYLITDRSNGKLYVGSATAQKGMLLQRWTNYINDGHGGNIELKNIVHTKGFDHIKNNFQYSILENYNARMDDSYILAREKWWKVTLFTKEFGYNKN